MKKLSALIRRHIGSLGGEVGDEGGRLDGGKRARSRIENGVKNAHCPTGIPHRLFHKIDLKACRI